ncbi:Alpha beta hydrolase fold protein [Neofusicoccum parvum]|nr:Alpha beta hydrolase fold protein [Neofusicoccum parvum]
MHLIPQLVLLFTPALCQHQPRVSTPQGIYIGNATIPGVDQFLGIPYAARPIGPLRFADPAPYTSGSPTTEFNATNYGPGCLQDASFADENGLSEDCLTLNIFRPSLPSTTPPPPLLPVLVFLYGGANIAGQPKWYNAPNLVRNASARAHPLLVATLNYRTGGLGFLANTPLAARRLLNSGLKDQRAALRWLHAHLPAFGGDPHRVVLFGQSAGSFDAWMQARVAAVEGEEGVLFQGVVLESGAPGSLALRGRVPADGDGYLAASLRALGCPALGAGGGEAALRCLRGVGAEALARVWFDPASELCQTLDEFVQEQVGFGVDGVWVTSPDYWDERVARIPMIVGTNLNEGSLYGLVPSGTATNLTYLTSVVAKNLNTTDLSLAAPVVATYYNHTAAQNGRGFDADPTAPDSYYIGEAVLGDAVQDIPRRVVLGRHSSGEDARDGNSSTAYGGAKTWGYLFAQKPPLSLFKEHFYNFPPDVPDANKIRAGVLHAAELGWISFAYHLDPNYHGIPGVPHWDPYDKNAAAIFHFEDQGTATPGMHPDDVRLDSYVSHPSPFLPPLHVASVLSPNRAQGPAIA